MGRQKSVGEVGLPKVTPQSELSVKIPPDQSQAQTHPRQRPSRTRTGARRRSSVENSNFSTPHELWDKEDWETTRKQTGNQKENYHGGGEKGAAESTWGDPTKPSKVQTWSRLRPCRRGPKKSYFRWRKRKAGVEEDPPLPLLHWQQQQHVEIEDWEQEISEQDNGEADHDSPYGIEDVLTVALMRLSVEQGGCIPSLYNPSVHHMPPVKWEYRSRATVEGQFSDAEE
ncbi:uncharacterized protein LOC134092383 [Sardina pilchardus]|uniref:uncharacterized protein LOC134092383 n=1 Tax=Sardina pilchardus TaxID=27697 RepID=UPI002E0ED967